MDFNSKLTIYFTDDLSETLDAKLSLKDDAFSLSFEYEMEETWNGRAISNGLYEMSCEKTQGKGILQKIESQKVLIGLWNEDGRDGVMRVGLR